MSLDNTFLQASFHIKNLREIDFYQRAGGVIPVLIMEGGSQSGQKMPLLSEEDLEEIMEESLPAGWLQEEVEEGLTNLFAYLKGESEELAVRIELSAVKESLAQNIVETYQGKESELRELPVCTWEQAQRMRSGEGELICRPSNMNPGREVEKIGGEISKEIETLPETIDLSEQLPEGVDKQLQQIQEGYQIFVQVGWGVVVVTGVLLVGLGLLYRQDIFGFLKKLSGVVFVLSLLGWGAMRLVIGRLRAGGVEVLPAMPSMGNQMVDGLRTDLITTTLSSYLGYLSKIKIVLLILTGGFLSFWLIKRWMGKERA